ncbi:protein NRT1/ PTR FAMILY 5.8 [Mercurialis annua]|uniref:protein NRT1/ PTR FAMILY 5.8 n=1 Tax=Mercurialis annua TaxID=3986 RepID=UPI00215EFF5F|nr:protein NRT1/ PTR FAMILY 5.8 [Mercurialis annua]
MAGELGEIRSTKGLNKSCFLLIVLAGMERFAFKGVASNLVTYLTDVVKMRNSEAAKTVNNWCGFTSMLPLLVASLADSCWDKSPTILASSFLYLLGLLALTSTSLTWEWHSTNKLGSSFLYCSLALISLGQGGYNPSLQAFGADQLEYDDELPTSKHDKKPNKKSLFFQWWYFGVCGGSLLGVTVMSYIQDTFGWPLGFAIPTIAMLSSIMLFCCGSRIYAYKEDENNREKSFKNIVRAVKELALRLGGCRITLSSKNSEVVELELQENPLCPYNSDNVNCCLNKTSSRSGTCLVENAKAVLRLIPIWTMLLMFAVIFQLPATFFTKQGVTMERSIGAKFKIPPATLQSAITVSIILLMPLYDKIFIPIIKLVTRDEKGVTVMQRMGIGMFLSIIAMIIAALVERKRLVISQTMPKRSETVPLSIFWLLPQYILLGISDIFTVVGMQEFFYTEVPVRMKTMGIALYTSVFGFGSFLSAFLITLVEVCTRSRGRQGWFNDDMREARLDKYYGLLAILSALSMLVYVILCKFFKSRCDLDSQNCK